MQLIIGLSAVIVLAMPQIDTNRQAVTIRGCVVAGTEPDTFLLTNVTEVPAGQVREQPVPKDAQGRDVLYWLNSTRGLKKEIGQRVEVKGTIDLDKPKDATTNVAEDPSKRRDLTNKISSGDKSVKAKTETSGASVKTSEKERDRVLYRLKVSSLRSVEGACR